jgi:tetratricopeptide (TPR) repeat protein
MADKAHQPRLGGRVAAASGWKFGTRACWRRVWTALFGLLALLLSGGLLAAQELTPAERAALEARKEALFQQLLRSPSNLDVTFAYADVAAKLGDNEGAVSALERMLLFNPNLPRVQLELGALYFRMGSYAISRSYFEKVLAANPPPDVRERVDAYLDQIERASSNQHFGGIVFGGVQYQSDANLAPASPLIASAIGSVLLNSQFVKGADENFFIGGNALYSYDLGTQNKDTLEVTGTGSANRYITFTRLDLDIAELTAGPRFNFPNPLPNVSAASLKPYAIVNDVSLGQAQYFHTLGVGGEATALAWQDWRFKGVFEFRDENFDDALPYRPESRYLNGTDKLVSLFINKPITTAPASDLTLEFDFLDQDTRRVPTTYVLLPPNPTTGFPGLTTGPFAENYYANDTYAISLSYHVHYDDPIGYLHLPWDTTFFGSYAHSDYDAPDPCCITGIGPASGFQLYGDQRANHWRFGVTQSVQVLRNVAVVLQLQRDVLGSNLGIYSYTSDSVTIGPQVKF